MFKSRKPQDTTNFTFSVNMPMYVAGISAIAVVCQSKYFHETPQEYVLAADGGLKEKIRQVNQEIIGSEISLWKYYHYALKSPIQMDQYAFRSFRCALWIYTGVLIR